MVEFIVNLVLIIAVLVLISVWAVSASRHRRTDRRNHAAERRLILAAFTGAAAAPTVLVDASADEQPTHAGSTGAQRDIRADLGAVRQTPQPLDGASVAALLDLLQDRRPAHRGVIASLINSPHSVWSAGARAGQILGQRTMDQQHGSEPNSELHRAAVTELVDIHAHDPATARSEYTRYAARVGDPAMAELYVRSAVHATYAEHDQVQQILEDITGLTPPGVPDDVVST